MQKVCHVSQHATFSLFPVVFPPIVAKEDGLPVRCKKGYPFIQRREKRFFFFEILGELFLQETAVEGDGEKLLDALNDIRPLRAVE